ncbi:MAG: Ribosomal protein S6 modification protein [Candidatus Peregrinibacteria bacterium GW2011_GWA2_47_7]|nr:MAG: Ribosomal protein S6 modification protein [Candidatus Peregrinibacteria bacterium GW2011_GWA2_47_7]
MRIGILTFRDEEIITPAEELLLNAAKNRGHEIELIRSKDCQIALEDSRPQLFFQHKLFPPFDVVITRLIGLRATDLDAIVVEQLQIDGIPVINEFNALIRARNKIRTLQLLSKHGLPITKTVAIKQKSDIDFAIDYVKGPPAIIKTAFGSLGIGVCLVQSREELHALCDTMWALLPEDPTVSGTINRPAHEMILWQSAASKMIMIQEYVKESEGEDIRVFMVGGVVIATMKRKAKSGEFRSNFAQGGSVHPVIITPEEESLAIRAVDILGLDYAGVDILRSRRGPLLMEVNCNAGLEGITRATGKDVAGSIIDFAVRKVHTSTSP